MEGWKSVQGYMELVQGYMEDWEPVHGQRSHVKWRSITTYHTTDNTYFSSLQSFAPIPQHYFSKYWVEPMHGPSPTSNFGGTVHLVPSRSPPLSEGPALGVLSS